jgi:hypothetical protein
MKGANVFPLSPFTNGRHLRLNEAVNYISGYTVSNERITGDELGEMWQEAVVASSSAGICLGALRKTMKTLSVEPVPGRGMNLEYQTIVANLSTATADCVRMTILIYSSGLKDIRWH